MRQNFIIDSNYFEKEKKWCLESHELLMNRIQEVTDPEHIEQLYIGLIGYSHRLALISYTVEEDIEATRQYCEQLIDDVIAYINISGDDLTSDGDLEWYINCLWYLSFCYFFNIPSEKVKAIADHISLTGKDMLIDRLIAASIPGQPIAVGQLAFPKVYQPLADALSYNQTTEERTKKIQVFLKNYYPLLKKYHVTWHDDHKERDPSFCRYSGYWIFELGALAADIGWDDTAYRDHEMYPKDLVDWKFAQRPDYRRSKI